MTRVLLADDHRIVREGLRAVLERAKCQVVAEASDGWTAVHLARARRPDVVLMDQAMPLLNGVDAAREILTTSPDLAIVLLSAHADDHHVVAALRGGVRGYVIKTQAATELLDAVRQVCEGGTFLSPRIAGALVQAYVAGANGTPDPLTLRDREVLQLVAEGKTTKDIAATLDLTVKTAEHYRSRIMRKLAIHTTAGLVRYAVVHGLVQLSALWSSRASCTAVNEWVHQVCRSLNA